MTDTPNQTAGLLRLLDEHEIAANIAWWTDKRDKHEARSALAREAR